MTSVNVSTSINTVTVTEGDSTVVTVKTQGPQGAVGLDLDSTAKVDKSVVYYDATAGQFIADATWTTSTLTFGGSF